jgi:hypothetical protein
MYLEKLKRKKVMQDRRLWKSFKQIETLFSGGIFLARVKAV